MLGRRAYDRLGESVRYRDLEGPLTWLDEARVVNLCRNTSDPGVGRAVSEEDGALKCRMADTGLLVAHAFAGRAEAPHEAYRSILFDKLELNEGMFAENAVAQQLRASGHRLFFYSRNDNADARGTMEVGFLVVREYENAGLKARVSPIEARSTKRYGTASLDKYRARLGKRVGAERVLHPKPMQVEGTGARPALHGPLPLGPPLSPTPSTHGPGRPAGAGGTPPS